MTAQSPETQSPAPEVQQAMNAYWTERSVPYDEYQERPERRDVDRAAWRQVWTDALGTEPLDVLDVGTGSGYVARVLADLGHRVTGIDLAEGMLERARAHAAQMAAPPRFELGDAVAPPFAPASFDALVNRYVMWTLREPDRALSTWFDLLRPGGTLAVVDATWFSDGLYAGATDQFRRAYDEQVRAALPLAEASSVDAVVAVVEGAGFTDVRVEPLTALLELDRRHGVAPGHELELQHLVRATKPA